MDDQWKDQPDPKRPSKKEPPQQPITGQPMMWKILRAQIRLISRELFSEEQKECRKGTIRTGDLLYKDQYILKVSKTRRKNLPIAWIDYKKADDMVSQRWII